MLPSWPINSVCIKAGFNIVFALVVMEFLVFFVSSPLCIWKSTFTAFYEMSLNATLSVTLLIDLLPSLIKFYLFKSNNCLLPLAVVPLLVTFSSELTLLFSLLLLSFFFYVFFNTFVAAEILLWVGFVTKFSYFSSLPLLCKILTGTEA